MQISLCNLHKPQKLKKFETLPNWGDFDNHDRKRYESSKAKLFGVLSYWLDRFEP